MILVIILTRNTVISTEGQEGVNRETWYKRSLQAFFKSSESAFGCCCIAS